jgi:hypothetical protein
MALHGNSSMSETVKNTAIVPQPANNATTPRGRKKVAKTSDLPFERANVRREQ